VTSNPHSGLSGARTAPMLHYLLNLPPIQALKACKHAPQSSKPVACVPLFLFTAARARSLSRAAPSPCQSVFERPGPAGTPHALGASHYLYCARILAAWHPSASLFEVQSVLFWAIICARSDTPVRPFDASMALLAADAAAL